MYHWFENVKNGAKHAVDHVRGSGIVQEMVQRGKRTMAAVGAFGFGAWVLMKAVPCASASTLTESTDTLFGFFPTIIELAITMMILGLFMGIIGMVFRMGPFRGGK